MYFLTPMCVGCLKTENNLCVINDEILTKLVFCIEKRDLFSSISDPTRICNDCLNALNAAFRFKENCLKNIVKIQKYLNQLSPNCSSKLSRTLEISEFVDLDLNQQIETILIEEDQESNIESDIMEIDVNDKNHEEVDFPVKENADKKILKETRMNFYNFEEPENQNSNEKLDTLILEHNYCCLEPTQQIPTYDKNVEKELSFTCEVCGISFIVKKQLVLHMRVHSTKYNCDTCKKHFVNRYLLQKHLLSHLNLKPHVCSTCGKSFTESCFLKQHQLVHVNNQKYFCSACRTYFGKGTDLNTHMLIVHNEPYSCLICMMSFILKNHLHTHMLTHTNESLETCPVCMTCFNNKNDLKKHMLTHTKKRKKYCINKKIIPKKSSRLSVDV